MTDIWNDADLDEAPPPVSPEAAPRHACGLQGFDPMQGDSCPACRRIAEAAPPRTDADREAKLGKMHGTLLSPEEAERVRQMLDEPAEAAPPRATTPEPEEREHMGSPSGGYSPSRHREALAAIDRSPSDEIGALIDTYSLECFQHGERHPIARAARAKIDHHIASLERDAARMREALENIIAWAELANERTGRIPAHRVADKARAAIAPSGEPTTTPEQNHAT